MSWTVDRDEPSDIITVTFCGASSGVDFRDATSAAIALSKAGGGRLFLIDLAEMSATVAVMELYSLAQKQYPAERVDPWSRAAVVMPATEKERDLAKFYETVCVNREWRVKLFENRHDARRWLLEPTDRPEVRLPFPG